MRRIILALLGTLLFGAPTLAASDFRNKVAALYAEQDDLGLRVFLRQNFKNNISLEDWGYVRSILSQRPNVGYDVVVAWDRQRTILRSKLNKDAEKIARAMAKADEAMFKEDFARGFELYQKVATYIRKSNKGQISKSLTGLYLNVLHQMGRALYAMGKFDEALEVYSWFSPSYPQIRQIIFEKMWAGFRSDRYDLALGAIASQHSEYFSSRLDPESYLLKIYILKRLCRDKELSSTVRSLSGYLSDLKSNKISYLDWAKGDLYRFSLVNLIRQGSDGEFKHGIINKNQKEAEISRIKQHLQSRFSAEKATLMGRIERILGYSALAVAQDQRLLGEIKKLPEPKILEAQGYEIWPAGDGEEWTDEIGSHVYIGDSQCTR